MFKSAKPIWLENMENDMNLFVSFSAELDSVKNASLHVTAAFFYRVFVNGRFAAFGPARTAKGYARKDVIDLTSFDCGEGKNIIKIEVAGYNCHSFATCNHSSFLCAEVRRGEDVIAYTGRDFVGTRMTEKEQKVERYSQQRHFGEVWNYTNAKATDAPTVVLPEMPIVIDRVVPYPLYDNIYAQNAKVSGTFSYDESLPCRPNRYSFTESDYWGRFSEEEIPYKPFRWIQKQRQVIKEHNVLLPIELHAGEYVLFDLVHINCGFIQFDVQTKEECDLVVGFSEYCENDTFAFTDINAQNVIEYIMEGETNYSHISFEPYTLRFAVIMLKKGSLKLSAFGVKTFERDMSKAFIPEFENPVLNGIAKAAVRTFSHNALDIFTDCPSRERAGWLCDSFFTAQSEYFFFGKMPVEDAYLQNFYLYTPNEILPDGILPMAYPADIQRSGDRVYIPQWNMWYVIEVEEYINKRGANTDRELFRPSIEKFLAFLERYENEDGMLERVSGWNFVEWSDANTWTEDVNYPTNFLYAGTLLAAYRLYGNEKWKEKAEKIRKFTEKLSFDGEMFTDNAVRENGVLKNTGNTSEAGQYYAVIFGDIDIDAPKYKKLKEHILTGCKTVPESGRRFVPINAFIGLYLRITALLKLGYYKTLLEEMEYFFGGMVEKTGTLWEYRQMKGSFDHGFASFVLPAIYKAVKELSK